MTHKDKTELMGKAVNAFKKLNSDKKFKNLATENGITIEQISTVFDAYQAHLDKQLEEKQRVFGRKFLQAFRGSMEDDEFKQWCRDNDVTHDHFLPFVSHTVKRTDWEYDWDYEDNVYECVLDEARNQGARGIRRIPEEIRDALNLEHQSTNTLMPKP